MGRNDDGLGLRKHPETSRMRTSTSLLVEMIHSTISMQRNQKDR
jgi:hypothetical protein